MMFSSRTLEERNNDPKAYYEPKAREIRYSQSEALTPGPWVRSPRPEFQHGVIPVNPILVKFREVQGEHTASSRAEDWQWYGLCGNWPYAENLGASYRQFVHATRVLSLLAAFSPQKADR